MTISPEESGVYERQPHSSAATPPAAMDADVAYLEKLGYKQELSRSLGFFSAFGIQFSSIAIASSTFTTFIVGLSFFGPASFWSFVVGGGLQVFTVGLAVAQLVSAYPLAGGVYQITGRITGKPWLAWQTGWLLVIAHTVSVTAVSVSMAPFLAGWFGITLEPGMQTFGWAAAIMIFVTLFNIAGVKVAALLNNVGVIAEIVVIVLLIGGLLVIKHPTQPLSFLSNSGGTVTGGHWLAPAMFAMILPAYLISSFDATGNASEETKNANRMAPLSSVVANTSAYLTGAIIIALLLLAVQDLPAIMGSAVPVKDILDSSIGQTFASIIEAVAIVALLATIAMLQLTGIRVLWSQSRDGQMPAAAWMRKVSRQRIPINATFTVLAMALLFGLWSSLLSVLAAMTALAWALAYTVVVVVGLWAVWKKRLPEHPWHYGKFSLFIFAAAVVWSVVLCAMLVISDPLHVGIGSLGVIAVGCIIYLCIPRSRRGRSRDTEAGHV
jgi:amino acid transporter